MDILILVENSTIQTQRDYPLISMRCSFSIRIFLISEYKTPFVRLILWFLYFKNSLKLDVFIFYWISPKQLKHFSYRIIDQYKVLFKVLGKSHKCTPNPLPLYFYTLFTCGVNIEVLWNLSIHLCSRCLSHMKSHKNSSCFNIFTEYSINFQCTKNVDEIPSFR